MGCDGIKTNVNIRQFDKAAADRVPLGVITKENGATITRMGMDGKMQTVEANAGDKLYKGDIVKTPEKGSMQIQLKDESVLNIGANTKLDVSNFDVAPVEHHGNGTMSMINSKITQKPADAVQFSTPSVILGVRG